jgi:uncharacterized protein YbaP (TraB family)
LGSVFAAPALAAFVLAAAPLGAGRPAVAQVALDEVVVSGERPGPPLWHVYGETRGTVAILGTVSPLPAGLRWRAGEVLGVLAGADAVLLAKPLQITLPRAFWMLLTQRDVLLLQGGRTLADVLPPELYARFSAQRAAYGLGPHEWDRYRPVIAGALLEDAAFERHGLSQRLDVSLAVRRLAREHHVASEEVRVPDAPDLLRALRGIDPAVEDRCLEAQLATVADGIPPLEERARAWSRGDVEAIRALPASPQATCAGLLAADTSAGELLAQTRREWLRSLEAHLRAGGSALAVVEMDLLLGPDGLLAALRADGFRVEGP